MKSYLLALTKWQVAAIAILCFISMGFNLPIYSQDDYLKQSTSDSVDTSSRKSEKLLPLVESIINLLEQKRYQIESKLEISATQSGLSYTVLVNTKTIIESPKFVSEIDFVSKNGGYNDL